MQGARTGEIAQKQSVPCASMKFEVWCLERVCVCAHTHTHTHTHTHSHTTTTITTTTTTKNQNLAMVASTCYPSVENCRNCRQMDPGYILNPVSQNKVDNAWGKPKVVFLPMHMWMWKHTTHTHTHTHTHTNTHTPQHAYIHTQWKELCQYCLQVYFYPSSIYKP
jgi:hypothetical protein